MPTAERTEHVMKVMDPGHGDFKVLWDPDNPEQVENARKQFEELTAPGAARRYRAYRVTLRGRRRGEPITAFDAAHGEILLVPQMAGGC